jgi:hypothetical protein
VRGLVVVVAVGHCYLTSCCVVEEGLYRVSERQKVADSWLFKR